MPNMLTIPNTLPAEFIALDPDKLDAAMALCQASHDVVLADSIMTILKDEPTAVAAMEAANVTYTAIKRLEGEIDESRLVIWRQIDAVAKQLNATAKSATVPLADQRARLGLKIGRAKLAHDELYRMRKAEAENAARAEEARRGAEAEAARQKQIDEAKAVADMDALPGESPKPLTAEVFDGAGAAAVRQVVAAYVPPPPKAAARLSKPKIVRVIDANKIPLAINGVRFWTLDERALKKAMEMGMEFPGGAELVDGEETSAAKGGRAS